MSKNKYIKQKYFKKWTKIKPGRMHTNTEMQIHYACMYAVTQTHAHSHTHPHTCAHLWNSHNNFLLPIASMDEDKNWWPWKNPPTAKMNNTTCSHSFCILSQFVSHVKTENFGQCSDCAPIQFSPFWPLSHSILQCLRNCVKNSPLQTTYTIYTTKKKEEKKV